ncbi:DUF3857 domain-containing protein [Flavobacterium sp.]|jgi:hypothetical protein|uniref:DUF3857 domain-containing protein n=1 Tax=Flavobacterium sp. TaxID=239 RepID=UPI0037BECE9E
MKNKFLLIFLAMNFIFSQNIKIPIITPEQKENANTIKIIQNKIIEYKSFDKVIKNNKYIVLVLNESGFNSIDLSENYDKSNKIKKINVILYNSSGEKIKSFNKSDFNDRSLFDDSTIFSDSRVLFLDYKPLSFPLIIEYECETESVNTAFLNTWSPISNLHETILESKLEIIKNETYPLKFKVQKIHEYNIEKIETPKNIVYSVRNILAIKPEAYADYSKEFPMVKMFLEKASLEGYELNMKSWKEFGKMYYDYFIKNNSTISEKTKVKLDNIISINDTKLEKIKKIYKYVQDNTRYISVQVGIGGWKPMEVSDVEKYGYGDCKALSNFTRSILKAYDIESYYTVIYGGEKKSFDEEIIAKQSNHVIVSVPYNDDYIFLECTSQTNPFGYLGDFTSNRNALIIKPDGAEVVNTTYYKKEQNTQETQSKVTILQNGSVKGNTKIISKGIQYNNVSGLEKFNTKEKLEYYKNHFSHLNNLSISELKFSNDKETFSFEEQFNFETENYYENTLNSIILPLNVFNRFTNVPYKYRNKKFSFEIDYGFIDSDQIEIIVPSNYVVKQLPESMNIKEKFGEYSSKVIFENNVLVFKRELIMNEGFFSKEEYESFRKFREQISKLDNLKILLEVK